MKILPPNKNIIFNYFMAIIGAFFATMFNFGWIGFAFYSITLILLAMMWWALAKLTEEAKR